MKSYFYSLSFFLLSILCIQSLHSQHYVSLGGFAAQPFETSTSSEYRGGGGFSMEVISKEALPRFLFNFQYGLHGDFLFSGGESFDGVFPFDGYRLQISNQSFGTHLFGRVSTIKAGIRFYGDVLVGTRMFYSTLTTFDDSDWEDDREDTDWLTGKLTGYYGASGGIQIRLAPQVYLDTRVSQVFGTSSRFVDLSSLNYANGSLEYAMAQAPHSNMFHFRLGVTWQMGEDHRTQKPKKARKPKKQEKPIFDRPAPDPLPRS